jgi:hypothetical protein
MDKWEYKLETINNQITINELNDYGKDGWELVFIKPFLNDKNKRIIEIILKRKKLNDLPVERSEICPICGKPMKIAMICGECNKYH